MEVSREGGSKVQRRGFRERKREVGPKLSWVGGLEIQPLAGQGQVAEFSRESGVQQ